MAIVVALAAALAYGASDFLGGLASRRAATLGIVVGAQAVGLVFIAIVVAFTGGRATASDIGWGAGCGVATAVAIGFLYRGLEVGTMGVVSPVSAVVGAALPLAFGIVVRGERPGWIALAGIAIALIAVTFASFGSPGQAQGDANRRDPFPPGIAEALIAGAAFGAWYITLAQTSTAAGMLPLLVARAVSAGLLVTIAIASGKTSQLRLSRNALALVLACGALDIAANGLYVIASHQGMLAIVAVLTSLYPATTIALAALVLHERLGRLQWTSVMLALGGAAAIAAGS